MRSRSRARSSSPPPTARLPGRRSTRRPPTRGVSACSSPAPAARRRSPAFSRRPPPPPGSGGRGGGRAGSPRSSRGPAIETRVIRVDSATPDGAALGAAVAILKDGGVAAFPTETFYGLGAAALDPRAVRRIFELKGRPETKPLLVLVDSMEMADTVAEWSDRARSVAARHWPGALTLVLPARSGVPGQVTART